MNTGNNGYETIGEQEPAWREYKWRSAGLDVQPIESERDKITDLDDYPKLKDFSIGKELLMYEQETKSSDHSKIIEKYLDGSPLENMDFKTISSRQKLDLGYPVDSTEREGLGKFAMALAFSDTHHAELFGLYDAYELSKLTGSHKLTNAVHMIGQHMTDRVDALIADSQRQRNRI